MRTEKKAMKFTPRKLHVELQNLINMKRKKIKYKEEKQSHTLHHTGTKNQESVVKSAS